MAKRDFSEIPSKVFGQVIEEVVDRAKSAVKYLDEKTVVKATLIGNRSNQADHMEIKVTFGAPNFAERKFIELCKKAGEPFPVKKIQLKFAKKGKG